MKKMLVLGAALLGFTFLGPAEAKADDCGPHGRVVVRGGYPVYAPVYYGGYGYYHRPYHRRYVRYAPPYRYVRPRVWVSAGY